MNTTYLFPESFTDVWHSWINVTGNDLAISGQDTTQGQSAVSSVNSFKSETVHGGDFNIIMCQCLAGP